MSGRREVGGSNQPYGRVRPQGEDGAPDEWKKVHPINKLDFLYTMIHGILMLAYV